MKIDCPPQPSRDPGPKGVLALVGLSPNSTQQEAGILIEPPPSLAWAIGIIPAATADEAPPLEPPEDLSKSQGFLVGPYKTGSVVTVKPSSGELVLPNMFNPDPNVLLTNSLVCLQEYFLKL